MIIVNIYAPNIGAPKYKQIITGIKGEIDSNTIIVGDFNTSLTIDRSSRQKINKETLALNYLDQMNLVYREYSIPKQQNTHFSSAHGTLPRVDYMLGYKTNLSKFKKTEIISSILSYHNTMIRNQL